MTVLDQKSSAPLSESPKNTGRIAIKTEKITKNYGRSRGIIELDLEIYSNEIFGFLGPNGAG
ncbi:MAG TPA: hypothetical protein VH186_12000, partial [Chloroflexia bacterium]|nr:hypothetical protein [Chloroflexia bacterium]